MAIFGQDPLTNGLSSYSNICFGGNGIGFAIDLELQIVCRDAVASPAGAWQKQPDY
jgi:hypothetical protein